MSMYKRALLFIFSVTLASIGFVSFAQDTVLKLGSPISEEQLSEFDLIAGPDGAGFPSGSGSAAQGKQVFDTRCAACHALTGEGTSGNTVLVGGDMHSEGSPLRTVGSYWPHASTLFDFIRRAMPADAPKSLTSEEVYQVTAYVLYLNGIVDQNTVINRETLIAIEMPNKDGFIDKSQVR
ncbi:MAG: cytochrome c [Gammaproteobacteria bacterium]|jgi:mono/diheme cytochrome c family protein|nr:cytochrome c [Gammaproteobacteria bacterium]